MKNDIIKIIVDLKEVDHVVILTYNVDLMFIQSMLLPKLKKCGHPNLLIFADIERTTETYQSQHKWVQGIGSRYRLVPVHLNHYGSFHPKAVLLSSEQKATLLVGSGNLSFAGWRENGETWIRYDSDNDSEKAVFPAFYDYLKNIINLIPLNNNISHSIEQIYAGKWAKDLPGPDMLIGRIQDGTSLIDEMFRNIDLSDLRQVTICTPFFDPEAEAIRELFTRAGKPPTRILVQNKRTNLSQKAIRNLPQDITILPVEFSHEDNNRHSFLHSKFYAFEKIETVELFVGSANCSRAALIASGNAGNAELLTKIILPKEDYERLFLNELEFTGLELVLSDGDEQEDKVPDKEILRILAVRQSGGEVRIVCSLPESYTISACFINDKKHDFKVVDKTHIAIQVSFNPHRIYIEATNNNTILQSPICWVDDEIELQISPRDRKLANTIDAKIKYGEWDIGGWIDIMRLIQSNLDYESHLQNRNLFTRTSNSNDNALKTFKYEDIFSDSFNFSAKHYHVNVHSEQERLRGLQQMLLSWFGIGWKSGSEEDDSGDDDDDNNGEEDAGEKVDKPEKLEPKKHTNEPLKEEDRERAFRVAHRIVAKLITPEFIKARPASLLGIDLSILGTLLCSGLSEGWLDSKRFYDLSYDLWHTFFFDADIASDKHGWLEVLRDNTDNPVEYENNISSVELSSILLMWALAAQRTDQSNNKMLFLLGCITSLSRTPWIWNIENIHMVLPRLWQNLLNVKMVKSNNDKLMTKVENEIKHILHRGIACRKLFDYLRTKKMYELIENIHVDKLNKGDILWQGSKHGLCILNEPCERKKNNKVKVLSLNNPKKEISFMGKYLLPVGVLLSDQIIPNSVLGNKEREIILGIFNEISKNVVL